MIPRFLERCTGVQAVEILGFRPREERLVIKNPVRNLPNLREIHFETFGPNLLLYFCWMFPGVMEVHAEKSTHKKLSGRVSDISGVYPEIFQSMKVRFIVPGISEKEEDKPCTTTDIWSLYKVLKKPYRRLRVVRLVIDPEKRTHILRMFTSENNPVDVVANVFRKVFAQ
jgi:hypothetical protein